MKIPNCMREGILAVGDLMMMARLVLVILLCRIAELTMAESAG